MSIGLIFECGPDGPDIKVCTCLLNKFDPKTTIKVSALSNKPGLINDCGKAAENLMKVEGCEKVIVIWDLYPAWREKGVNPCRKEDREAIAASMKNAGVKKNQYELVCIEEELEAWLIADERALKKFIEEKKHPHRVGNIKKQKAPDSVRNPKTLLTKIFNKEIGGRRKYVDYQDAEPLIKCVDDFTRLKNSNTFRRFIKKATGRSI